MRVLSASTVSVIVTEESAASCVATPRAAVPNSSAAVAVAGASRGAMRSCMLGRGSAARFTAITSVEPSASSHAPTSTLGALDVAAGRVRFEMSDGPSSASSNAMRLGAREASAHEPRRRTLVRRQLRQCAMPRSQAGQQPGRRALG